MNMNSISHSTAFLSHLSEDPLSFHRQMTVINQKTTVAPFLVEFTRRFDEHVGAKWCIDPLIYEVFR